MSPVPQTQPAAAARLVLPEMLVAILLPLALIVYPVSPATPPPGPGR